MVKKKALALSNQLCFAVYSASHAFTRAYRPILEALDLTYPQYLVLLVLWEDDNRPVKDIGARLFLDSGTLTPLLKRLEQGGYVQRTRDAVDERQVRISLTAQGRALKDSAGVVPAQAACMIGLSREEAKALIEQLVVLRDNLHEAAPVARKA